MDYMMKRFEDMTLEEQITFIGVALRKPHWWTGDLGDRFVNLMCDLQENIEELKDD